MRQYVSRASFNPGAKFLILFIAPKFELNPKSQTKFAYNLFRLMYVGYNAANVIFLYATKADEFNLYITNPYQMQECGKYYV